jgi:hypothetical protein
VPVTTGIGAPKPKIPKWVTIAAGGVAVVAIGVGIAVVASSGDDSPTLGGTEVVVDGTDANGNPVTVPAGADTTTGAGSSGTEFDLTPILATWIQPCQPFLDGSGASQGSMTLESPGPNQLNLVIAGGDAATADCAGGFEQAITVTYPLTVTAAGTSGDVQAFVAESAGEPSCVSTIDPGACGLALGTIANIPTALGVDGSGQLVVSNEVVTGGALPTTWEPMVEGATRA